MRIDLLLVEWGFAPSRAKAQELIRNGDVEFFQNGKWLRVELPSQKMTTVTREDVRVSSSPVMQFVSRGGLKLSGALEHIKYDVTGLNVLDVGISTGGFTDCLLQKGARRVVGVDVGRGQLAEILRGNPQLVHFEGVNAREMDQNAEIRAATRDVQLCVADVSFISLTLVLPAVTKLLPTHDLIALIKPQYELTESSQKIDPESATERVRQASVALGYQVREIFPSQVRGGDGNLELFIHAGLESK